MTTPAVPWTDAELIARTRTRDMAAYDELYRRHIDGANRVARNVTRSPEEAQEVVSEAFTRVLDRLRHGGGPDTELSPYLNTVVRRLAIDRYRASRREGLAADPTLFDVLPEADEPIARSTDRDLVRRAFETLPERWQQVLWFTEIEGRSPAALAPTLGSTPNAVAALAYRAREGLRQAYLSVHLSADIPDECRPYVPKLAAYVRGTLSQREDQWVAAHVEQCPHCRERRDELMLLVTDLRGVLWPALLLPAVAGGAKTALAATGAAATAGVASGWSTSIPKPKSLAGQIAATAAAVAAVSALVVATVVMASDDNPLPRAESGVAAPDPGRLDPPLSVPRPSPTAASPSPSRPSTVLPPVGRPPVVPVVNPTSDPAPPGAGPTAVALPSAQPSPSSGPITSAPASSASRTDPTVAPAPAFTSPGTSPEPTSTPTPTVTPTSTPTSTATPEPTPTARPTPTSTPTPTFSPTPDPTPSPTVVPSPTPPGPPPPDAPPWWWRLWCRAFLDWPGC